MFRVAIKDELDGLTKDLARYQKLSGKSTADTLIKQGRELSFQAEARLKTIKPEKGSITRERLAAMAAGRGLRIRQSIRNLENVGPRFTTRGKLRKKSRGKLSGQQDRVRKELAAREKASGFLAFSTRVGRGKSANRSIARQRIGELDAVYTKKQLFSRTKRLVSSVGMRAQQRSGTLEFVFEPGPSFGLKKAKAHRQILLAIKATRANIIPYIYRKELQLLRKGRT